jgi:hypothetical protein
LELSGNRGAYFYRNTLVLRAWYFACCHCLESAKAEEWGLGFCSTHESASALLAIKHALGNQPIDCLSDRAGRQTVVRRDSRLGDFPHWLAA